VADVSLACRRFSQAPLARIGQMFAKVDPERKRTSGIPAVLRTEWTLKEPNLAGSRPQLHRCDTLIAGFLALEFVKQFAQPLARLV
jgi:hypothetical protein